MAKTRLTTKQIEFCRLIGLGMSGTEAYQKAFKRPPSATSRVNACKLLKMPLIVSEIERHKAINSQIVANANITIINKELSGKDYSIMDRAERMDILTRIARGEIPLKKPMVVDKAIVEVDVVPDWTDRKNAIAELNKMDGSYAPAKIDANITKVGLDAVEDKYV